MNNREQLNAKQDNLPPCFEALKASGKPMVITDDEPKIIWANKAWAKMTGYTLAEAIGKNPSELVKSGLMRKEFYVIMWKVLLAGNIWKGRITNRRKNGHIYTEEMVITPFISSIDGKKYYYAVKEDVSLGDSLSLSLDKERKKTFFEMASSIMVVINAQGIIDDINITGANLLGYRREELLGKNWFDVAIPQIEREKIKAVFKEVISGNLQQFESYTNQIVNKKGEVLTIAWKNYFLTDKHGNMVSSLSSGMDITNEVKKSEIINRHNQVLALDSKINIIIQLAKTPTELLKKVVDILLENTHIIGVWMILTDEQRKIKYSYQKGLNQEEFANFINHLKQVGTFEKTLCLRKTKGMVFIDKAKENLCKQCPFYYQEPKGKVVSRRLYMDENDFGNLVMIYEKDYEFLDGELQLLTNIYNNIALAINKIKAEHELIRNSKKYQVFFENDLSANYITTPDGKIIDCNKAFMKLIGFENKEVALASNPSDFYLSETKREDFVEELKRKKIIENSEKEYLTVDRKKIDVLENTIGVFNENGDLIEIRGFIIDITELKDKERELQSALEKAKESESLKSAFLANISHEIRTPMNHIMGFAYLLRNNVMDEKTRNSLLDTIQKSGDSLVNLMDDIIELSKIDAQQLKIKKQSVDLNSFIDDLVKNVNEYKTDDASKVYFTLKHNPEEQLVVDIDKEKTKQVLVNILNNAFKFTDKGEIVLSCELDNNYLVFSIKDTGIGIEEKDIENIFKRFVMIAPKERENLSGAGLGLSISNELVNLMGGEINVDSVYGIGSQFKIKIPISKLDYKTTSPLHEKEKMVLRKKIENLKVLIAEDDESNYQLLSILLKPFKPDIKWAKDGQEAIDIFKQHQDLDIILMDLKMPKIDGFAATKEIKRKNPKIPIIAQTAYALVGDEKRALDAGCDYYLSKPIRHKSLKRVILNALNIENQ